MATLTLKPVTDGRRTFWHWELTFGTPPGRERELHDLAAQGVYEAGFDDLRRHLAAGGDLRGTGGTGGTGSGTGSASGAPMPLALPLPTRRVVVAQYGGAEQLVAQDGEAAAPGPGELRIRQRAIGVNCIDVYLRRGAIAPMLAPIGTPGMEAAGSVIDVGEGVHGFLPGDRVAYIGPQPGAYCSMHSVPAAWAVRLPAVVEDATAAAVLL